MKNFTGKAFGRFFIFKNPYFQSEIQLITRMTRNANIFNLVSETTVSKIESESDWIISAITGLPLLKLRVKLRILRGFKEKLPQFSFIFFTKKFHLCKKIHYDIRNKKLCYLYK